MTETIVSDQVEVTTLLKKKQLDLEALETMRDVVNNDRSYPIGEVIAWLELWPDA